MALRQWDKAQLRFWEGFRALPRGQKFEQLQKKVEAVLPLQGFTLVWVWRASPPYIALGYEGRFRIKIHWKQWHRYAVEDDMIYITYSRLQTPFLPSDFQETSKGRCLAWFGSSYLYGYLTGVRPTTNVDGAFWEWVQQQFAQRDIDLNRWLATEIALYRNAFFLHHFGIEPIARVFMEEWEAFRAYVTAYEQTHASPNFLTLPCP